MMRFDVYSRLGEITVIIITATDSTDAATPGSRAMAFRLETT